MPSLKAIAKAAKSKAQTAPHKKALTTIPSSKSTEYIRDSDEEDNEKQNDESSEASDSDNESLPAMAAPALSKANGKVPIVTGDSSSASGSESDDESASEEEHEVGGGAVANTHKVSSAVEPAGQSKKSAQTTVSFEKAPPFTPPTGFQQTSIDIDPKSSKMFGKSNLEGKQIWYITAPASVPITSIGKTALQNIEKGTKVLSNNSNNYGFTQDASEDRTHARIMAPSSSDDGYHIVSRPVDRILHLQQIVNLSGLPEVPGSGPSRALVPAKKPVRQQPPGLKMRYRPIGFGDGKIGKIGSSSSSAGESSDESSDQEMTDSHTAVQTKKHLNHPSKDSDADSNTSSDVEMADVILPPPTKPSKSKPNIETSTAATLKRKHSDGNASKAKKHSSSQSNITTDYKQLNDIKIKQTKNKKISPDSRSVSTEPRRISKIQPPLPSTTLTPVPLLGRQITSRSTTHIPPPSLLTSFPTFSHRSVASARMTPRLIPASPAVAAHFFEKPASRSHQASSQSSLTQSLARNLDRKEILETGIKGSHADRSREQPEPEREGKEVKINEAASLTPKAKRRNSSTSTDAKAVSLKEMPIPPPRSVFANHNAFEKPIANGQQQVASKPGSDPKAEGKKRKHRKL